MKSKKKILSRLAGNKSLNLYYRKQLNKLGKQLLEAVKIDLLTYLKANEKSYRTADFKATTNDSIGADLLKIFEKLNTNFTGTLVASFAKSTANDVLNKINRQSKNKFDRILSKAVGVDINNIISNEGLEDFMDLAISENVSLIKSLPEEYLKQVEVIVNKGVRSGARYSTIAKEITAMEGSANSKLVNRIKTIARDQVETITSQMNIKRSENLGITKGIYRTSRDERVRKSHKELDGVEFDLNKGAWSKTAQKFIIPGVTDINCRCGYSPVLEV